MCFHLIFELIPRKHKLDFDTLDSLSCLQFGGGFHRHIETDAPFASWPVSTRRPTRRR
jgi:hypothetical protein